MEFKWSPFPFLRFTLALVTGILVSIYFPQSFISYQLLYSFITIYGLLFILQRYFLKYSLRSILGVISLATIFIFGHVLTQNRIEVNNKKHLIEISKLGKINAFVGTIIEPVKETDKSLKTVVNIDRVRIDSQWIESTGKVLCYFGKDSIINLKYANQVLVASSFGETEAPKNPAEFDYKKYLLYHNIYHRAYINANKYSILKNSKLQWIGYPNILIYYAQKVRGVLENKLKIHFKQKREYGIAQALILGVKDELENDVIKAYSGVGAMHVLAVSGLHVGLVYQIFLLFFGWMGRKGWKTGKYFQATFLLLAIWMYAFVTGLSPSVMRAATMFSFIIVGQATGKQTNIYNTLAVSAFFLLCINPFLVVEVGFQLSYFAVLGIVYIQPKIYRLLDIDNSIMDSIWSITCVSIAAQLGTFPLGLLYFHQFPTYFFISNLVVIPAAVIILYSGIFVLSFSWWNSIAETLTYMLEKLIWLINEIIFALNKLPYALLSGIDISILESWLIYFTLFMLILFFYYKRLKFYVVSFLFVSIISAFQFNEFIAENEKNEITFYSVNKHLALGLRNGNNMIFISDDSLSYNSDKMQFHVWHHWWRENVTNIYNINLESIKPSKDLLFSKFEENTLLLWHGKSFLFYKKPFKYKLKSKVHIDYFVIRNNVWIDKNIINNNLVIHKVIIDGSNNWKTVNWVKKSFPSLFKDLSEGYYSELLLN